MTTSEHPLQKDCQCALTAIKVCTFKIWSLNGKRNGLDWYNQFISFSQFSYHQIVPTQMTCQVLEIHCSYHSLYRKIAIPIFYPIISTITIISLPILERPTWYLHWSLILLQFISINRNLNFISKSSLTYHTNVFEQ